MAKIANGNGGGGGWQKWVLGIGATMIGSLIVSGITFQRETRREIAENNVEIHQLQARDENIIKYVGQRMDERLNAAHEALLQRDTTIQRLEKRIEELERRAQPR